MDGRQEEAADVAGDERSQPTLPSLPSPFSCRSSSRSLQRRRRQQKLASPDSSSIFSDASSPSKPVQLPQESVQPDWPSVLTEMKKSGSFVTCPSDVLIPDFSASDAAYICTRHDFSFGITQS
jgi:hypothetical protein